MYSTSLDAFGATAVLKPVVKATRLDGVFTLAPCRTASEAQGTSCLHRHR